MNKDEGTDMISWVDFLSYELGADERGGWWTLGDEHINHMLLSMLIVEDNDFLADVIGHGPRILEKWDFGGRRKNASPFDIHVRSNAGLVLVEFKTWAGFTDRQIPPNAVAYMEENRADRLVYVLLTAQAANRQSKWSKEVLSSDRIRMVDFWRLIKALEGVNPQAKTRQIAMDYASALRRLTRNFGWQ